MKSEARIQQEIVMYFNNEYPELRGCLCYNNNNSVGGLRGKLNKFLGVIKGRSDMIELKTEKGIQSQHQKDWQKLIENQGFEYYIVRSIEEFKELILKIIIQDE